MLADPSGSRAVLIGCAEYTDPELDDLPAVRNNLTDLAGILQDGELWGLPPEHCTVLADPRTVDEVLDAVHEAASAATEMLLVYYAGHGVPDVRGDLFLALGTGSLNRLHRAIRFDDIRREILGNLQCRSKVVILDCCYAGSAMTGEMSGGDAVADRTRIDGTYLLTASSELSVAHAPVGERHTAFTGELVAALGGGLPEGPDLIDLDTLYWHLRQEMEAKTKPIPQQRSRIDGRSLALVRNRRGRRTAAPAVDDRAWLRQYLAMPPGPLAAALGELGPETAGTVLGEAGRAWPGEELASLAGALRSAGVTAAVPRLLAAAAARTVDEVVGLHRVLAQIGSATDVRTLLELVAERPADVVVAICAQLESAADQAALLDAAAGRHTESAEFVALLAALEAAGHGDQAPRLLNRVVVAGLPAREVAALIAGTARAGLKDATVVVLNLAADRLDPAAVPEAAAALRTAGAPDLAVDLFAEAAIGAGVAEVLWYVRELRAVGRPLGALRLLDAAGAHRSAAELAELLTGLGDDEAGTQRLLQAVLEPGSEWPRSLRPADLDPAALRPLIATLARRPDTELIAVLVRLAAADAWPAIGLVLHELARADAARAAAVLAGLRAGVDDWRAFVFDPPPATAEQLAEALQRLRVPAERPWQEAVTLWKERGDPAGAARQLRLLTRRTRPDLAAAASVVLGVLLRDEAQDHRKSWQLLYDSLAKASEPVRAVAYLHLAIADEVAGRTDQARANFGRAANAADPVCAATALLHLAWSYADDEDDGAAWRTFEAGLARNAEPVTVWLQLGFGCVLRRSARPRQAAALWAKASTSADPLAAGYGLLLRAELSRDERDLDKAYRLEERLLRLDGAEELWPVALERAYGVGTGPDDRVEAMTRWLTWLVRTGGRHVTFHNPGDVSARVVIRRDAHGLEVCAPVPSRRGIRRRPDSRSEVLHAHGFADIDDVPADQPNGITEWLAVRPGDDPARVARLCETVFSLAFGQRPEFDLKVGWDSAIPLEPLPRPAVPDLLP
ncbi:caspase, EACC1-associated type [Dactylosporangium sp. CS-047395]|uniref:caspase, EACC1-associated type n=1 Tax=Dactylosporangium sp. CS-047395 TaxID=3239936 RepID=UPI003D928116